MSNIRDLPIVTEMEAPVDEDVLLISAEKERPVVKRFSAEVFLRSIPIEGLLDHILRRLKDGGSKP